MHEPNEQTVPEGSGKRLGRMPPSTAHSGSHLIARGGPRNGVLKEDEAQCQPCLSKEPSSMLSPQRNDFMLKHRPK